MCFRPPVVAHPIMHLRGFTACLHAPAGLSELLFPPAPRRRRLLRRVLPRTRAGRCVFARSVSLHRSFSDVDSAPRCIRPRAPCAPVFARTLIPSRTTAQPSSGHCGERARFCGAFPGGREGGSRACSFHPCVPLVYLACTSCRSRAKAKRFRDRLCTCSEREDRMTVIGLDVGYSNLKIAVGAAGESPRLIVRPAGAQRTAGATSARASARDRLTEPVDVSLDVG